MCGCMAAQVKVRACGLGLLRPRLNGGLVCDDSAVEGICANAALCKWILPFAWTKSNRKHFP